MRVGERAKVARLSRTVPSEGSAGREAYVDQTGIVMRRLNVAWETEHGELWEIRFDDGTTAVFSTSELEGNEGDLEAMREGWGKAPRVPSLPFKRFGAGVGAAPAVLALLVFALAGVLLVWAGVSDQNVILGIAGAVLVLIGIVAAGVLIS